MNSITDVSISIPTFAEVMQTLLLRGGYNSVSVIVGTTFLGLAAGLVGTFSLLRKRALVGDALAHCTLPGLALAFITAHALGFNGKNLVVLLAGAAFSGIIGILAIQLIVGQRRLGEDAAIGIVLSTFFGFGILLLSVIQGLGTGSEGGLNHFIYGQTAAMGRADSYTTMVLAIVCCVAVVLMQKEFRLVCFDQEFASAQGWRVSLIDLLLMVLIVGVTITGLQSVGLLLIVAFLIIPATAARFWTERLSTMIALSALFGAVSGYLGAAASTLLPRLPAGSVIVLIAGTIFLLSFLFAPERGLLANMLRFLRLRLRVAIDHVLRAAYEEFRQKQEPPALDWSFIKRVGGWTDVEVFFIIFALRAQGLIDSLSTQTTLTKAGMDAAQRLTRNHELWEQYLLQFGRIAPTHVDYSADLVEHVLSPDVVQQLERALARGQ